MMKRTIILAAVMAMIASTAMAANLLTISPVGTQTSSEGRAITPDGVYVGGNCGGTGGTGFIWDAVNLSRTITAGSVQTNVNGIGYRYPSDYPTSPRQILVGGNNGGWESMNTSTDGGATWLKNRRTNTHAYVGNNYNMVAGTSSAVTPGRIYSTFSTNTQNHYTDRWEGAGQGAFGAGSPDAKSNPSDSTISGVSSEGTAVGRRKYGSPLVNRSVKYVSNNAGGLALTQVSELPGSTTGALWDIADDGSKAGGESGKTAAPGGVFPYILNMATGATTELPVQVPAWTGPTWGRVYGMSPSGNFAVGMDYSRGSERAVLWDTVLMKEYDLTDYASYKHILDGFTGNLRRAYAVGVDGSGHPVITGWGVVQPGTLTRGFVLTMDIPEPGTMAFLLLGSLALLRRR